MLRTNYHTHTMRCNHANGSDEEYVLAAIAAGYKEIGFADHTPWPYKSNFVSPMRMKMNEFENYVESILYLKEKYKNQISIKLGLECEYFEEYEPWLQTLKEDERIDYLIFGNHFYKTDENGMYFGRGATKKEGITLYVDQAIEGMKKGYFTYLCHPDLFMRAYLKWDEHVEQESTRLCLAALELDIPLEYNLQGIIYNNIFKVKSYPYPAFWELAVKVGNKVIIGVDAHQVDEYTNVEMYEEARRYLQSINANIEYELKDM